jgi:glycosyltransferase involved in cell wall biosynthesis
MRTPTAVLDLEISGKFTELNDIGDFVGALVLFRLHGRPLGWGAAPVTEGRPDRAALVRQLLEQHAWSCALPLAERAVCSGIPPRAIDVGSMLLSQPPALRSGPLVTVAVCSRTPASQLSPCLDSLLALDYTPLDIVLIDASDDRARVEALVRDHYPTIRYCDAPGAGAAPRRAIAECRGDVLALTHGDAVVDRRWVSRLVAVFLADPEVMTVSGLTLPPSIGRPMRAVLPAGAPFCREWARVGLEKQGLENQAGSMQRVLECAGANVAFWHAGTSAPGPYTHVFEPAAIVRASSASPSLAGARRVPIAHATRTVDLAAGLQPIVDAEGADDITLNVTWSGAGVGTAHIAHHGATVSPLWIADAIAQQLTVEVLDARLGVGEHVCRALLTADLARHIVGRLGIDARSNPAASSKKVRAA